MQAGVGIKSRKVEAFLTSRTVRCFSGVSTFRLVRLSALSVLSDHFHGSNL